MENSHFKKAVVSHKFLAQERTLLANERNTLAYIRTGFSAFVLGIASLKFFEGDIFFLYAGWVAVVVGVLFILFGLVYYPLRKKRLSPIRMNTLCVILTHVYGYTWTGTTRT